MSWTMRSLCFSWLVVLDCRTPFRTRTPRGWARSHGTKSAACPTCRTSVDKSKTINWPACCMSRLFYLYVCWVSWLVVVKGIFLTSSHCVHVNTPCIRGSTHPTSPNLYICKKYLSHLNLLILFWWHFIRHLASEWANELPTCKVRTFLHLWNLQTCNVEN